MNLVQHEARLDEHEARLRKLEGTNAAISSKATAPSALEEAIRKAKESAKRG